jgi:hypothetical protein
MRSLYNDSYASGFQLVHEEVRNLACQSLLNLQPFRETIQYPRDLTEPKHFAIRQVRHMGLANKRHHVMFAHAVEWYIAKQNDLVIVFMEHAFYMIVRAVMMTGKKLGVHPRDSLWRIDKPFTIRIFAHRKEYLVYGTLYPLKVDLDFVLLCHGYIP